MSFVDFSPRVKQTLQPGITGGLAIRYTTEKYFAMLCAAQSSISVWRCIKSEGYAMALPQSPKETPIRFAVSTS